LGRPTHHHHTYIRHSRLLHKNYSDRNLVRMKRIPYLLRKYAIDCTAMFRLHKLYIANLGKLKQF
jgi:hypothetical protein